MDIYLTDLNDGDRIRFPMMPEEIGVQVANIFQSYTIMAVGQVKIPYGEELTGFTWRGIFPGEMRRFAPFIREWQRPQELIRLLETFRTKGKKLRLLVTETNINHDVYIQRMSGSFSGGYGDYQYTLNLVNAKELVILESNVYATSHSTPAPPLLNTPPDGKIRPEPPQTTTHTVVSGDTLWGIAQRYWGAGIRYPELHAANMDVIGPNPNRIFPGQVLTLPS